MSRSKASRRPTKRKAVSIVAAPKAEVVEKSSPEKVSPEKLVGRSSVVMTALACYSGPLPPAREFGAYEAAHPGSADRILAMAEKSQEAIIRETATQAAHRRQLENQVIPAGIAADKRGQCFALVIAMTGLLTSGVLGIWGNAWVAGALGPSSLALLAGVFISERQKSSRQAAEKKAEQNALVEQPKTPPQKS